MEGGEVVNLMSAFFNGALCGYLLQTPLMYRFFFSLMKRSKNQGKTKARRRAAPAPTVFPSHPLRRVPKGCSLNREFALI